MYHQMSWTLWKALFWHSERRVSWCWAGVSEGMASAWNGQTDSALATPATNSYIQGKGRGRDGWNWAGGGRIGPAWVVGLSGGFHNQIQHPALGRAARHRAACFSAIKIAGGDSRSPIASARAFPRRQGQMSPAPKRATAAPTRAGQFQIVLSVICPICHLQ